MAQAKHAVKHYHANNGTFAQKGFLDEVNRKVQKITFCAVGAHHIENKTRCLPFQPKLCSSTAFACGCI
jgi:hypothetical protein